ncbi:hypothetical protein BDB00DRAFT_792106 [Zychaea mexicana]|uniref:uncharacterized protein n=1 Tax=Zychaea mexicana TaxID=64656 RepID=UPI0022FEF7D6|nr:uncharacterized protein BDB00DRAFT_792106 [Zychaea mexicana]KAI9488136.1 hypothetical protein BDB00DRAFT_792106 [Zychaea mexicana]
MTELQQQQRQQQPSSSSIAPLSMTPSNESTPPTTTDNGSALAIRAPSSTSPTSDDQPSSNNNNNNNQHHSDADNDKNDLDEDNDEEEDDDDKQKLSLDRVHLTLLLISGNRHTFEFDPLSTVAQVKKHVITEWPPEWESNRAAPQSVGYLELLYLGKFLENDSTLESNRLRGGESFTVHLLVRDQQLKSADGKMKE